MQFASVAGACAYPADLPVLVFPSPILFGRDCHLGLRDATSQSDLLLPRRESMRTFDWTGTDEVVPLLTGTLARDKRVGIPCP